MITRPSRAWPAPRHLNTISNFETGRYGGDQWNLDAIRAALESVGVEFANGKELGVKLRRQ